MRYQIPRRIGVLLLVLLAFAGQGCSSTGGGGGRSGAENDNDSTPANSNANGSEPAEPPDNGQPPMPGDEPLGPAGIVVSAAATLSVSESGATARFTIALERAPSEDVTVPLASTNTAEATVSPDTLTFTRDNWGVPQTVTVTGVDDYVDDDSVSLGISVGPVVSSDSDYNGLEVSSVPVTNQDNETAGVTVVADAGAATGEDGATATFSIALNSQPTGEVTLAIGSTPMGELSVAPAAVTFNADNWDQPQTVTLTGLDDALEDGDVAVTVAAGPAVSDDAKYEGMQVADVIVINRDNETETFTIEPDDFPAGAPLTSVRAAVTLSTALDDNSIADLFVVTAADDGLDLSPTGERVFGHESIQFFNGDRRLRLDFARPAREIRLTFGGGTFFETEVGVLQAYDTGGILLAEYTTSPLGPNQSEVMTITRPSADIAWAVAYSQDSFGRLDALVFTVRVAP